MTIEETWCRHYTSERRDWSVYIYICVMRVKECHVIAYIQVTARGTIYIYILSLFANRMYKSANCPPIEALKLYTVPAETNG